MINREASQGVEAIRLQKLRAVATILDYMNESDDSDIAVAIEIYEDVYVNDGTKELFEQNKNYDQDSAFTLNSDEILKSLCSFIDIWVKHDLSDKILFCFLSTNQITKERQTDRANSLGVNYPQEKVLEVLSKPKDLLTDEIALDVKSIVHSYYKDNFEENSQGTAELLNSLSVEVWKSFLFQVKWIFKHPSVSELEISVKEKITGYKLFSALENTGKEELVLSRLLDLIEKKSTNDHRLFRLIFRSDVRNAFLEILQNKQEINNTDEVYKLWEKIEKPTDTRNLSEKILGVCPEFDVRKVKQYERKAAMAKVEEQKLKNSSKYLALKYRVYEFCDSNLLEIIVTKDQKTYTEEELISIITKIRKGCVEEFQALKKDYNYGLTRDSIVLELFLEFIDSCFLSFEKNE